LYLYQFGAFKWPIIVAYLLPNTLEDLHHVQAAFDCFGNDRATPILMADLNVDLYSPSPDIRCRMVVDFLAANGVEDMLQHFHSRRKFRHQKTWYQKRYNPPSKQSLDPELITSAQEPISVVASKICSWLTPEYTSQTITST